MRLKVFLSLFFNLLFAALALAEKCNKSGGSGGNFSFVSFITERGSHSVALEYFTYFISIHVEFLQYIIINGDRNFMALFTHV